MTRVGAPLLLFFGLLTCFVTAGELAGKAAATERLQSPATLAGQSSFAGDTACEGCHGQKSNSYIHTAHRHTSSHVTKESVLGSFATGANTLTITPASDAEPGLKFRMEERKDGFYQSAVTEWGRQVQTRTERMDLMTGSGVRGATYLYWEGDRLFELPVSYWTDGHRWINSPGYTNGTADFSRPVSPGCLECHATYIRPLSDDPATNNYDRASLVTGIMCERCHGSGLEHIARHKQRGAATQGEAILNPAKFTRDRQVDLCALCHNGIRREALTPAFSYRPGESLSSYFKPLPEPAAEHPDVHGNQVGLLERSKCYLSSPTMSCSMCHDVHAAERPAAAYSEKCLGCHQWQSCPQSKTLGRRIANNCIDCHMPVEPTNVIVSETGDAAVHASMRNHWIKVYPAARRH
jgi:hypothetical protein